MAAVIWTEEQQQAIGARDSSLLVAAAAGSGKTAVLVERIIQRILDPAENIDIDRLMIVTFTDAAASEMRERIGAAIANKMNALTDQADPQFRKRLKRQLTLLPKATICTMHAFCSKLLRKHFHKIDLDPDFRVLDAIEADLLKDEAMEQVLEQQYEGAAELPGLTSEDFLTLLDLYGGKRGDDSLKTLILRVYEETGANPFPKQWRERFAEMYAPEALDGWEGDFCHSLWGRLLKSQLQQEIPDWIRQCLRALELCEMGGNPAYLPAFQYHLQYFQNVLHILEANGDWDSIRNGVQAYSFDRFASKTKGCDEKLLAKTKDIAEEMKRAIGEYREAFFAKDTQTIRQELEGIYPILKRICLLVDAFEEAYGEKKRTRSAVDYGDLEHFALRILTEYPEVSQELRSAYEEVYTDEYQDTNMTQETILSLVTRIPPAARNLFMVGDIKQSIYGFRQARPDIFLEKYYRFSKAADAPERLIPLYKNFRSRKDVIGSVNYLFGKLMTRAVCGMDYTREEYLYYGADYKDPAYDVDCELLTLDRKEETDPTREDMAEKNKLELEAAMIGKRIRELLEEADGALRYKDIVILLRATRDKAEVYREGLAALGIPVFCDVNAGFYQSKEGSTILAMLQIIDNPLQDIPLLSVLKSPIGDFSEEEIARLRLPNRDGHLYYNVKAWAEAGDEKSRRFLEQLSAFRVFSTEHDLSELVLELYRKTDYYNYAGIFPDGLTRQANLQKIYEEAVRYENQTGGGIFEFLSYVERIRSSEGDLGGATVLGENDNVVRIMSIHKSKGLEFPVVFLANMDKGFNRMDSIESVLTHQELGFGMDGFDRDYRVKYDTINKFVIKWKKNQEMIAEEIRLLYVAMTRAKEKLILSGMVSDLQKSFQKYWEVLSDGTQVLPVRYALKAKSYFDLVLPILLRHPDLHQARAEAELTFGDGDLLVPQEAEECRFQFRLVLKEELFEQQGTEYPQSVSVTEDPTVTESEGEQQNLAEEVARRLSATYAFWAATQIPAKISVSALNHNTELPQILQQPRFLEGKRTRSAAEWGTITHYILQYIPLDDISKETILALCRKQGLSEEEIAKFDWMRITRFFQSDIGMRMKNASCVYREKPFTMEVPSSRLFPDTAGGNQDSVLVQGIIDCYFEEPDGVVILDYKTDRVAPGKEFEAAENYRLQLDLYRMAVEAETGKKVKETMIYFLQTGKVVVQ